MSVLLADIGGTHARFCVSKAGRLSDIYRFRCSDCKSVYQAIQSFLVMQAYVPEYAVIAIAGVVADNQGKWTNLSWTISEKELKRRFGFQKIHLLNDLIPQGAGIASIKKKDWVALNRAGVNKKAPKVLLSLGTGLGACLLLGDKIYPTEYGQTMRPDGCTLEKVLCGLGRKSVYTENKDQITLTSLKCKSQSKSSALAEEQFFFSLAQAMQNLALVTQPFGGLYITGGMLQFSDLIKNRVAYHMTNHPTMKPLLKKVPVFLITNKDLAFLGLSKLARKYGLT